MERDETLTIAEDGNMDLHKQRNKGRKARRRPKLTEHAYDQISPNLLPLVNTRYV